MVDDASCHLSCYTSLRASIWRRYGDMVLPGRLFQEQRSVGPHYYTDLIYSFLLHYERRARGVKKQANLQLPLNV